MTKTLTKTTLAALALGLSVPATAATDGQPGSTSTGSFDVTLTVSPPLTDQVQVVGLKDMPIGTITTNGFAQIADQNNNQYFCLNRTSAGNVLVTVEQLSNPPADTGFQLSNGNDHLPFQVAMQSIRGPAIYLSRGVQFSTHQSEPGCSAANVGYGVGHLFSILPFQVPATATGLYSATIQITIAPAG